MWQAEQQVQDSHASQADGRAQLEAASAQLRQQQAQSSRQLEDATQQLRQARDAGAQQAQEAAAQLQQAQQHSTQLQEQLTRQSEASEQLQHQLDATQQVLHCLPCTCTHCLVCVGGVQGASSGLVSVCAVWLSGTSLQCLHQMQLLRGAACLQRSEAMREEIAALQTRLQAAQDESAAQGHTAAQDARRLSGALGSAEEELAIAR